MSDFANDIKNKFSSIDSPDTLIKNILQKISNDSLDVKKIISLVSDDDFQSSKNVTKYILEEFEEKKLDPKDLFIESEMDTPIQSNQIMIKDFSKNSTKVLFEISKETTNRLIQYLPAQYSKYIPDLPDLFNQICDISKNPDEKISKITEDKINEILQTITNDYFDISIENFLVSTEENEKLKFDLKSKIIPPKPFIKINMEIAGIPKELVKIVFQIDGKLDVSDVELTKEKSEYVLKPGKLFFELKISLKKLSLIGNKQLFSKDGDESIRELADLIIEKKFKKITLS